MHIHIHIWVSNLLLIECEQSTHGPAHYMRTNITIINHVSAISILLGFTGPRDDAMITPLSQCVEETGGKALYATVSAGDHLQAKLVKTSLKGEGN